MPTIIAVDIGGTQMRAASYAPDQIKPIKQKKIPTLASTPGGLERLLQVIEEVLPTGEDVAAIGLGSPGPLDPHTGYLLAPPNNPEWHNFPLAPKVEAHFGVPAFLDNDANLAALAEYRFGSARVIMMFCSSPSARGSAAG
jgi:glucokinase